MLRRDQTYNRDKNGAAKDKPTRKVGEHGGQADTQMIDERLGAGDDDQEDRLVGQVILDAERRTKGADEEGPGADVDGAEHGDEAEKVKPCRNPTGTAITEYRAPVIETAGCRVGGADLRHRHREHQRDEATEQPADADTDASGAGGCLGE